MSGESKHTHGVWFDPPSLSDTHVRQIALDHFGVTGRFTSLRGERDQNLLVTTSDQRSFVLKIAGSTEDPATVDFQCRALEHIATEDPELPVPRVVRSGDDELHVEVLADDGTSLRARLLTFLPGRTFDDAGVISLPGLRGIGAFQGRLAASLSNFQHGAANTFMPWALDSGMLARDELWKCLDDASRPLVEPYRHRVDTAVRALAGLRRHVIHNDAHRGNLLRRDTGASGVPGEEVIGVIDFGDLVTSAAAADLGVSAASFVGDQVDPAAGLIAMAGGYDAVRQLEADEIEVLPELVLCRLVLSSLMTDFQVVNSPHIASAVAAERPGLHATLSRWTTIDPVALSEQLHDALQHSRQHSRHEEQR